MRKDGWDYMNSHKKTSIIVNEELLEKNKLKFTDLYLIWVSKTKLIGFVELDAKDIYKSLVIGAYIVTDNDIVEISATSFKLKSQKTNFELTINEKTFDKIHLYADFLNYNLNNDNSNEEIKRIESKMPTPNGNYDSKAIKKLGLIERLNDSIEVKSSVTELGLKLNNTNIVRGYNKESIRLLTEVTSDDILTDYVSLNMIAYDSKNLMIDSVSYSFDEEEKADEIIDWTILKDASRINKIVIKAGINY